MSEKVYNPDRVKKFLEKKTQRIAQCWVYTASFQSPGGYCKVMIDGKRIYIHRLSAHIHWGFDLDSPKMILHKVWCLFPSCWNPEHLYEGDQSDNMRDAVITMTHKETAKTHCPKGHPLDGLRGNGKRYCKTCNRIRAGYV